MLQGFGFGGQVGNELFKFLFPLGVDVLAQGVFPAQQVLLHGQLVQLTAHVAQAPWRGAQVQADPGAGGIQYVDGFVRQLPARQVAGRHFRGGFQGAVGDQYLVGFFVDGAQATEDVDGFARGRLVQGDWLKAAAQGRVFFEVFLVLAPGGGSDGTQLAAGQGWLQQVGSVGAAFAVAGANEGVGFVDEQDDWRNRTFHGFDHAFQALLKLAFNGSPGLQSPHVQGPEFNLFQAVRHVAVHNPQGQAFHQGTFSHAGITHHNGVVLAAAAEDVNHLVDFGIPAYHRVQLFFPAQFGEVGGVALERVHIGIRHRPGRAVFGQLRALNGAFG